MKKSSFWQGYIEEQYSFLGGINETVEDKDLIRPHSRYTMASTDWSDSISLRKLGLSTDGLGLARLPYDGTGLYSGFARGMGIFQLGGDSTGFITYFSKPFPTEATFADTTSNTISGWTYASDTSTTIQTLTGPSANPVGVSLPCHSFVNGVDILSDYQYLTGIWNISGTSTYATLIQQGIAPTTAVGAAGVLNNSYAYCYTFVDANGNESQPSPLGTIDGLVNQKVTVTVTPTGITQGVWSTFRIYRTLENASTVLATNNPTFYFLTTVTVTGAGSYNYTDNTTDATLQLPTNYRLTNVAYINGALQALSVQYVPKFSVAWNNQVFGGFWMNQATGTEFSIRVYWSASVDNSQTSTGNCTSWNSLDYLDVGTKDDGKIIGLWPGLQGRLYVFKEFSTYVIEPTGAIAGITYQAIPVSNEYGFFHHSVDEMQQGSVVGRVKNDIMVFNGSTYRLLGSAPSIRRTLSKCIQPEADSGRYDATTQRYYLAVCNSEILDSYQPEITYNDATPTTASNIVNCFRNESIAFDIPAGQFETHLRCPIQVYGNLKDSGGRKRLFGLGMTSDIFVIIEGNAFGPCYSAFGIQNNSPSILNLVNQTSATSNPMYGSFLFIPYFIDSDGKVNFTDFMTSATLASASSQVYATLDKPALFTDAGAVINFMCVMPDAYDTVSAVSGDTITLTNNNYNNVCVYGYGIINLTQGTALTSMTDGIQASAYNQLTSISGGGISGLGCQVGDKVLIIPYRTFAQTTGWYQPTQGIVLPPFGLRTTDTIRKQFDLLRLHCKGSGTVYVYGYKDGNETYKYGPYLSTPDETNSFVLNSNSTTYIHHNGASTNWFPYLMFYQQSVYLSGLTGYYMRYMIWCPKGSAWFEMQDMTSYQREMEALATT